MSLLVNRLSSNITKLLSNNILNNAPESVPIRHHVGYIPAQGRIHPWDTEESRVQRQIKAINLKPIKRLHFSFDPFHPSVKSMRHIVFHFSSDKIRATNPKCAYKTDILSDRSEPTFSVQLDEGNDDLGGIIFKTANLKVEDILTKFNSIILPLVKTESDDERTTKGAKKNVQSDKKKKGGK